MKRMIIFGLAASMLFASMAAAQVETKGRIVVIVEDPQGSRLPGATVTASAPDTVTSREGVTNALGEATLVALDPSAEYAVQVEMPGFATARNENVLVRSGHTATLRIGLSLAGVAETVTVTSETPLVDTTTAITGQDVTLELTESLPTGRTYQSYLQLVPGVMPDDPDSSGNPASKSGLNYRDVGGDVGVSRDNFYYIDGINVTDGTTGTFGANLNTEIIQEQKVLTGGLPAEYQGTPGLVSNVVLKAGSNNYSGSVNYFFQNDGMELENENSADEKFSRYDTAVTFGGPAIEDQLWFFGSYRRVKSTNDVTTLDTNQLIREVNTTENQGYIRGTWSPTGNDTVAFTWLNDPFERDGRLNRDDTNARNRALDQGGNRYNIKYSRLLGMNALLDFSFNDHEGEVTELSAIREERNDVFWRSSDPHTLADEQLGGFGRDLISIRGTSQFRAALDYSLDVHDIKVGFEWRENSLFENSVTVNANSADPATWSSLAPQYAGTTIGEVVGGDFTGDISFNPTAASDLGGLIDTINARPDRQRFYDAYDVNGDGTITAEELSATMTFDSTAGNPHGQVNYDRTLQVERGPQDFSSQGLTFFAQDSFRFGNFVVNGGVRMERWEHFGSDGTTSIFTFPWTVAPRLSAIYDLQGDGRQKISAFWGRYYDPIRNNMTNFAGQLTGEVRHEQVFALGEWLTYRVRGGAQNPDAFFAPTTQTPLTDDIQLGYAIDLGENMSFEALYTHRRTRQILEDYDLRLYAFGPDNQSTLYEGPLDHPDSLWLGFDYFGYDANPGSNFVIATLARGQRDYDGVELTFRKRFTDKWQALASYTYSDATGNTNSDSNADFQGDVIWLDPGAPNQEGPQPGLIRHLFKAAATYQFDMGLEVGGFYRWNNGFLLSKTWEASRRHLPGLTGAHVDQEPFEFAGFVDNWIGDGVVGGVDNPSWGQLDLRVQYVAQLGGDFRGEFFLDWFNVFNNQDAFRVQDVLAGTGGIAFGEPFDFIDPTRFFVGARLSF